MTASTVSLPASAAHLIPKPYAVGLVGILMTAPVPTTSLDDIGDIVELGYVPANCTLIGFIVASTDMDSAGPSIVHKLSMVQGVTTTDLVTGLTEAQAGTASAHCLPTPVVLTAIAKIQIAVTTAAATAVAGTLNVTALYINN